MQLQISSGQGPAECELAVKKFVHALSEEFDDISINSMTEGSRKGCYKSAVIESKQDLSFLDGTVRWICKSPFRPNHKRKNWFINVSIIVKFNAAVMDHKLIRFDSFRSGGKGGQHVNKVETGIRATYPPLRISAISTDERSQYLNQKIALKRLKELVDKHNAESKLSTDHSNWKEHTSLVRGNAARVYEGLEFKRVIR